MTTEADSVLVVDDDEMNRDMLSRRLRRRGLGVTVAEDGERALALIDREPFDLVLLDVMMPGLSGLDVLRSVRKSRSATDLPIIMATARTHSEDVADALRLGANDYVTKPLDFPVVLARVENQLALKHAVDRSRALERQLAERNRSLESANARMSRDLHAAARVQASLLPRSGPGVAGVDFAWDYRPCDELAGDGLNVVRLDDRHVGLYVFDVSGHGVASALLSVSVARVLSPPGDPASILAGHSGAIAPPSEVADRLNRLFPFDMTTEQYFTMVYGVLDATTGLFRYVSAGHPGPVLVSRSAGATMAEGRGYPIGLADDGYEDRTLAMAPGDRLYLYSDGVPEAADPDGRAFGGDRLCEFLGARRASPLAEGVEALKVEVERWCGASGVRDDVSILAAEFHGRTAPGATG